MNKNTLLWERAKANTRHMPPPRDPAEAEYEMLVEAAIALFQNPEARYLVAGGLVTKYPNRKIENIKTIRRLFMLDLVTARAVIESVMADKHPIDGPDRCPDGGCDHDCGCIPF